MDTQIAKNLGIKQARILQYENQCITEHEGHIVQAAYDRQEKARKDAPDAPPESFPPIVKYREWYAKAVSKADLSDALNTVESMGFQIQHVVSGLGGEYVVTGCRVIGKQIPEKMVDSGEAEPLPSIDPAKEPPVVGEADEDKRREWENATD